MIRRDHDAARINQIANDPAVYPSVSLPGQGRIDLGPVVADMRNFALIGEHGAMLFKYITYGFYAAHTMVLAEGRGRWTGEFGGHCLYWMFTRSDAVEIVTRIPVNNRAARIAMKHVLGEMHPKVSLENGWIDPNSGQPVRADIFRLHIEDWADRTPALVERGTWFHHLLEDEYKRVGKPVLPHADDPGHDRIVGLTVEMIQGGMIGKALNYYNRWAAVTGLHHIKIANNDPLVIDTGDDRLLVHKDTFEVVPPCQ